MDKYYDAVGKAEADGVERLREALQEAHDAIAEYYRYWTGGETRGSYDGKPERARLWKAQQKARTALAATPKAPATDAGEVEAPPAPYLSDRFEWAAPGDQQEDAWIVRFCDKERREAIYTGPDAEAEARSAWEQYAPGYNMYLFQLARLSTPPVPNDDLRAALEWYAERVADCRKITPEGDNARQALDLDGGKRARAALSQPLAVDTGQSGAAQRSLICLTPGCSYSTEIKTSYSHSSYGNARVSVTALFPSWQSLKVDTPEQLNYVEHVLHHHMEKAVAEIGRYDLALGGTMAQEWPATPTQPAPLRADAGEVRLREALDSAKPYVQWYQDHSTDETGKREAQELLDEIAALKENRRG